MAKKKIYVIDTSVYLTDAQAIYQFGNNDIVIPLKVLEEIDKHKKRQDGVGSHARKIIRILDELRAKGNLQKGVRIEKGKGILRVKGYHALTELPSDLNPNLADNIIIGAALTESIENPSRKVIVVSKDVNMRVICDSVGVVAEDFKAEKVLDKDSELYSGFASVLVDDQIIDQFYNGEPISLDEELGACPNEFIMLVSNANEKKSALARYINPHVPLVRVNELKDGVWGVRARNKEQSFALDILMNPEIPIISLVGRAGCGKTLCAIAAGMEQCLGSKTYNKLIVSRPVQPMGKDIGFLPGTLEEKMMPWLAPIRDNLEFLMDGDKDTLDMYLERGLIEIEALTYIRGRSIASAFIIIDEAQNLTSHELKTIITRVGEGTKIVLTGDIEQIDNAYIDQSSNGLTYAVEKFKAYDLSGHVTLKRGERSKVASLAAKIL
jgi:PhoH-like ATPase